MTITRRIISITAGLVSIGMLAIAVTVPMIAMTGPALLGALALVVAYVAWPRHG